MVRTETDLKTVIPQKHDNFLDIFLKKDSDTFFLY